VKIDDASALSRAFRTARSRLRGARYAAGTRRLQDGDHGEKASIFWTCKNLPACNTSTTARRAAFAAGAESTSPTALILDMDQWWVPGCRSATRTHSSTGGGVPAASREASPRADFRDGWQTDDVTDAGAGLAKSGRWEPVRPLMALITARRSSACAIRDRIAAGAGCPRASTCRGSSPAICG